MTRSYTDTTYVLADHARPLVTLHDGCVSIHRSGYLDGMDGRGFALLLRPAHLDMLREAVAKLESLDPGERIDRATGGAP